MPQTVSFKMAVSSGNKWRIKNSDLHCFHVNQFRPFALSRVKKYNGHKISISHTKMFKSTSCFFQDAQRGLKMFFFIQSLDKIIMVAFSEE